MLTGYDIVILGAIIVAILTAYAITPYVGILLFSTTSIVKLLFATRLPALQVVDYTALVLILTLLAAILSSLRQGTLRLGAPISVLFAPAALAGLLWLSLTYTTAPSYGMDKALRFTITENIAWLVPFLFVKTQRGARRLLAMVFLGGTLISGALVLFPQAMLLQASERASFIGSDPLGTADVAAASVIIGLAYLVSRQERPWLTTMGAVTAALGTIAIVQTGSRGPALGAMVASLLLLLLLRRHMSALKKSMLLPVVGVILALAAAFSAPEQVRRLTILLGGWEARPGSFLIRENMWQYAASRVPEALLVGHGSGSFAVDYSGVDARGYPHNMILECLYEVGTVGLIIWAIPFMYAFRSAWRLVRSTSQSAWRVPGAAFICLLLYYLVQAMKSGDFDSNRFIWFYAAAVIAAASAAQAQAAEQPLGWASPLAEPELVYASRMYGAGQGTY